MKLDFPFSSQPGPERSFILQNIFRLVPQYFVRYFVLLLYPDKAPRPRTGIRGKSMNVMISGAYELFEELSLQP